MRVLGVLTVVFLAAVASAQEPSRGQGSGSRSRDEAFKMVDAYIVSNLQESLGLSDEQFTRLLPLVTKLHSDRRESVRRRIQNLRELRRLMASGRATEAQVAERLREIKRLENDDVLRRDREAVDAALTPLQQAKFRVLESEVEQKIRALRGRRQMGRPGGRSRRQAPAEQNAPRQ